MELKGKIALFPFLTTTVDIVDVASGEVVQQHDVEGRISSSASVQKIIAVIAVDLPMPGVHVMDLKSARVLIKFVLPSGENACVTLSKDASTLVATSTGL
jgi:hypothetical protein